MTLLSCLYQTVTAPIRRRPLLWRFTKYSAFGCGTLVAGWVVLQAAERILGWGNLVAFALQATVAFVVGFVVNLTQVWGDRSLDRKATLSKWLATQFVLVPGSIFSYPEVVRLLWQPVAFVGTKGSFAALGFGIGHVWAFRSRKQKSNEDTR